LHYFPDYTTDIVKCFISDFPGIITGCITRRPTPCIDAALLVATDVHKNIYGNGVPAPLHPWL